MVLLFFLFRSFSFVASRLPFALIYLLADLLKFILKYVVRYRRAVIQKNLSASFPEKTMTEIRSIMGQYYRNLADITLEVIKLETISKESLLQRFSFTGLEILQEAFERNQSVIVTIGHCGNWEWMGTVLGQLLPVKGFAIVKPLSEKYFNRYVESLRHRINPGSTIPFQHTYRVLVRNRKEFTSFNVFAADQTPTRSDINYWSHFLNQDTPFYTGVEKIARSLGFAVVFIDITRTGRGRYHGEIQLITRNPDETGDLEITENYIRLLETAIRKQPDNWLWSHRRWKFSRTGPNH